MIFNRKIEEHSIERLRKVYEVVSFRCKVKVKETYMNNNDILIFLVEFLTGEIC